MTPNPPKRLERLLRGAVLRRFQDLQHGQLTFREGDSRTVVGRPTAACPLRVELTVHDPAFYRAVALGGSIGAAESYMDGHWDCDDLTGAVRILAQNRATLERMDRGLSRLAAPLRRLLHWMNRNTRAGSRRNIAAHYDLGNEFFQQFLDPTMMYSAALFEDESMSLEQASRAKIDRVCRKLDLGPDDHLLEIGTGWGALAVHAAREYGCRVTTATISREQHRLATERVRQAGLADRVEVVLQDYRDLRGQYDKLVSIEMIEAVGHQYLEPFFARCSDLLKPDGRMLLQVITIAEQEFERTRRSVDFIQRYIFPGSCLPSQAVMAGCVARATDLRILDVEDLTPDYARTLAEWRRNFRAHRDVIRAMGFPESFLRMWEYYFCYCEGGFAERVIGDVQIVYAKPLCRATRPRAVARVDRAPRRRVSA